MKKNLLLLALFSFAILIENNTFSQCVPGDATTCPDPENNGQVCPAVLPPIYVQANYEQQFTVLAPPELDTNGLVIPLHHITLLDVLNLPEGIIWQSNATNNEFFVGTYYCVLLSGVSNSVPGNYPIKIVVDIYASVAGTPVKLGTMVDSTSLSVEVTWDPNAIIENSKQQVDIKSWPNPFRDELTIQLNDYSSGTVKVSFYNLLGVMVYEKELLPDNEGKFTLNTSLLSEKTYLLSVTNDGKRLSKIVSQMK